MTEQRQRLSVRERMLYGAGHVGTSVVTAVTLSYLLYRYQGQAPALWIGGAMIVGRIVDAVTDPLVGHWSDSTRSRMGRRKPFILWGTPALAITFLLLWTPPVGHFSGLNAAYLAFMSSAFLFAFTVAVCPYLALLPELAPEGGERSTLAAVQAAFNVVGVIAAVFAGMMIDRLGYVPMGVIFAVVTWVTLWMPLAGRKEHVQPETETIGLVPAIRATLANRPFLVYVGAYLLFWFGLQVLTATLPFYVEVVLGMKQSASTLLQGASVGVALVLFTLLPRASKRWGKKRLMLAGYLDLACAVPLLTVSAHLPPGWRLWAAIGSIVLAAPAVAVIFAVPNAVMGDLCDYDEKATGRRREGMYFGVQGFMVKLVLGLAFFAASQMVGQRGETVTHPGGVMAAPLICAACGLAAYFVFRRYPLEEAARAGWGRT